MEMASQKLKLFHGSCIKFYVSLDGSEKNILINEISFHQLYFYPGSFLPFLPSPPP